VRAHGGRCKGGRLVHVGHGYGEIGLRVVIGLGLWLGLQDVAGVCGRMAAAANVDSFCVQTMVGWFVCDKPTPPHLL